MKKYKFCLPTIFVMIGLIFTITSANAQQDLLETVADGCKMEIEKYCGQVTPGQGRILACLFAHGDKLSEM